MLQVVDRIYSARDCGIDCTYLSESKDIRPGEVIMGTVSSLKEKMKHDSFDLEVVLNNEKVAPISVKYKMDRSPCSEEMCKRVLMGFLLKKGHIIDSKFVPLQGKKGRAFVF